MLRRLIGPTARSRLEPADRGAVDDGAGALLAHLAKFEPHAVPDAPEIDRDHPVEIVRRGVGGIRDHVLDAGVVVGCVQSTEGGDGLSDHGLDLPVVRHVAGDRQRLVALGHEVVRSSARAALIAVGQRDGRS